MISVPVGQNNSSAPKIKPQQGARFASVRFASVDAEGTVPYQGIWGGKKLSTDGTERGF
jgi:hypothetical protein